MEEIVVTRLWMGGVVAMMMLFGVVAVIGYVKSKRHEDRDG